MKILCHAPHSHFWSHAFPEALSIEALKEKGHEIIYVTCGGAMKSFCVCMATSSLRWDSPESLRSKVCQECTSKAKLIRRQFGFKGYEIAECIGKDDLNEIDSIISQVSVSNWKDLCVDNIQVGRISAYEMALFFKKYSEDWTEEQWAGFLAQLKSVLVAIKANAKILKTEKPDKLLGYILEYGANRAVYEMYKACDISCYSILAGNNLKHGKRSLNYFRDIWHNYHAKLKSRWQDWKDVSTPPELAPRVTDHILELFRAENPIVYSAPPTGDVDIRRKFHIPSHARIMCATMSSYDELQASVMSGIRSNFHSVFATQIEWISELIEFMKARQDLFLIVRVHPREFPNKNEGVKSEHAFELEKAFEKLPENVCVNWPIDGISLYDLAMHVDVFLNAWSAAGREMSLLGHPVVIYTDLVNYPTAINYYAKTRDEYFRMVDIALNEGWQFIHLRDAYRWSVLEMERCSVDISAGLKGFNLIQGKELHKRITRKLLRMLFPLWQEYMACFLHTRGLPAVSKIVELMVQGKDMLIDVDDTMYSPTEEQETMILIAEAKRIAEALFSSRKSDTPIGAFQKKFLNICES